MAREAQTSLAALPPPLPPETRTVGQLVAESVRLYGRRFWRSLLLGLAPAATGVGAAALPRGAQLPYALTVGAAVTSATYAFATLLVAEAPAERGPLVRAVVAGWIVFLPVPLLTTLFVLPAVAWLALVGLVVPVILLERRGFRAAIARAIELARADYVHAAGALATLVIVAFLSASVLFFLLRGQGGAALHVAAFLAVLVISPVVFLGSAILYFDQRARLSPQARGGTIPDDVALPPRKPGAPGTL